MDRKKSIFFICVTLIVLALIYYIFKKFKGRTLPTPSPPAQTDELSISDLKFVRTLNPDKSNSKSEISGYTIEYAGINYVKLSENVEFTITWKNNIGFNGVVKGFKIKHYVQPVQGEGSHAIWHPFSNDVNNAIFTFTDTVVDNDNSVNIEDFGENTVKIVSTNYSVIGENAFKIEVIKNDETTVEVYDGVSQTSDLSNHHIPVSEEELGATLEMTAPQSVTYTPVVSSDKMTSIREVITKVKYNITNSGGVNLNGNQAIFLLPATPGSVNNSGVRVDAETFFFKYTDGEYLLHDLSKGAWNNQSSRSTGCDDACHTRGEKDNRIYIAFYNSGEIDGNVKTQLRKTNMGYGLGIDFISSDANGTLILSDMASQTGTVSQTEYNNSFWTFNERIDNMLFINTGGVYAFGTTVCISGDDAFVGDPDYKHGTKTYTGRVTYYKRSGAGVWEPIRNIMSPVPEASNRFGSSISASGDYVVIGETGANLRKGAVHVFMRAVDGTFIGNDSRGYVEKVQVTLDVGEGTSWDMAGKSVAIVGDTIVVGIPGRSSNRGAIRVYKRDTTATNMNQWLNNFQNADFIEGELGAGGFGSSVDISEDQQQIIVGAPNTNKDGKNNTGSVHIYKNTDAFTKTTLAGADVVDSKFGTNVSISGKNGMYDAVVGGGSNTVFVYKYPSSSAGWLNARVYGVSTGDAVNSMANIIVDVAKADSVSISGDTIVIGHSAKDENTGEVTVVKKNGSDGQGPFWNKTKSIPAPIKEKGAKFGKSVHTDGYYVIIGEPSRVKTETGSSIKGAFYITTV